ncbi:MAG: heme o synthase [Alphaproteobacteria bacterium]|nr:heme o synthase [Rhodospirillales bacterium]MCW9044886.1 heme o synthase [Alphaproteobacteria bacterium]
MGNGISDSVDGLKDSVEQSKVEITDAEVLVQRARLSDYAVLLKPRVMSLVVFTGYAGLYLAPGHIGFWPAFVAVLCIAIGAGASGAINMWYDRDIDSKMERTINRPIPAGRMKPNNALWFGIPLAVGSVILMAAVVNNIAAALLAMTIAYYVFLYTMWLKRRTPQNIVIGGASGAFPPMIGWAAVTGGVDLNAVLLFAIIFMWTPPHFWALALFRAGDYEKAGVPMLPVVAGVRETKKQIFIYTVLLAPIVILPAFTGMASLYYGIFAVLISAGFIYHAIKVWNDETVKAPKRMFFFSLLHLFLVFAALLADKALTGIF